MPLNAIEATWFDPDGGEWPLSGPVETNGWLTTRDIAGWGSVPIEIVADPLARGGERVRHIRSNPRRITWPLYVYGDDHLEFVTRYRALMRAFTRTTQRRTPGVLRIARADGMDEVREIEAFYEAGFEGEGGENWLFANPVLTLYCPDGYWRGIEEQQVTRYARTSVPFLNPYPRISTGLTLGSTTITNPGEVDAWPQWVITGPATQLVATNTTLDESFTLTLSLSDGEQATIITAQAAVRGPAGQNLVGNLNWPTAQLWPLAPGDNEVTFTLSGSSAGTSVALTFRARYEAA